MRILIVDDDLSNLSLMKAVLEKNGYRIVQALNGQKALDILRTETIDLIISDILMPVMDGYHLCRECKSDENLKNIPFIFCSGTYTDKKDENLSIQFGAEAFIAKPFHNKQLLQTIDQVIQNFTNGKINIPKTQTPDDKGVYKLYSERLIKKLEEKMLALDKEKMALEMEIAERVKIENRLRKSRNFSESLFNTAPGIILILDTEGRIVRFNPYMAMVSGYASDDVKGKYWVDVFSPENGRTGFSQDPSASDGQSVSTGNVSSIITRTGEKKEIMWFDSTLKDDTGKTIGLLAVGQDITLEMKRQKETLQAKTYEAIGNFSDDFARELDQITTALRESISLLEAKIPPEDQQVKDLEGIKNAAKRVEELASRLAPKINTKKS